MDQATYDLLMKIASHTIPPALTAGATHWWHTKTRSHLQGLTVDIEPWNAHLDPEDEGRDENFGPQAAKTTQGRGGEKESAIRFKFINATGERVVVSNARIGKLTDLVKPNSHSTRNVATDEFELKFRGKDSKKYENRETVVQSDAVAYTVIVLADPWKKNTLKPCKRNWLMPWTKKPNLFQLSYEVIKAGKLYKIRTPV